jgi:putative transposase
MPRPYVAQKLIRMDENGMYHNRKSNRLPCYDYATPGAYFITIVSYRRLPIFGEIISGEIQLSQIGEIVEGCWVDIPLHFTDASIDAYVIMPNHLHGIVKINEKRNVGATHASPILTKGQDSIPIGPPPQSLSAIIGSLKSAATKGIHRAGLMKNQSIWPRNYYEHVIRDDKDYQRIVEYIQFNPINWEDDQEFVPNDSLIR